MTYSHASCFLEVHTSLIVNTSFSRRTYIIDREYHTNEFGCKYVSYITYFIVLVSYNKNEKDILKPAVRTNQIKSEDVKMDKPILKLFFLQNSSKVLLNCFWYIN